MISFLEFNFAVRGLARLLRFDAGFSGFFDLSQNGARRSFWLALPILPLFLFMQHLNANRPADADLTRVVAAELIGYALIWIVFPLTLMLGARLIDRGPRIFAAIAIYNWLTVVSVAFSLPIEIAQYFGLDPAFAGLLQYAVLFFMTACEWFAFRKLLDIGIQMVIALVVIDFAEGQIVFALMDALGRAPLI